MTNTSHIPTDKALAVVPRYPAPEQLEAGRKAWLKDPLRRSSTLYVAMVGATPFTSTASAFRSSATGDHWPIIGKPYLVRIKGVLQPQVFTFDQGDDGVGVGEQFWYQDTQGECPAFNPDSDEWLPLDEAGQVIQAHPSSSSALADTLSEAAQQLSFAMVHSLSEDEMNKVSAQFARLQNCIAAYGYVYKKEES